MSDLKKRLDKIILDIEKKLNNKNDFEYVKNQIYNVFTIFLDEFDEIEENYNKKMDNIALKCKVLDDRMSEIENSIEKIENDIYIKENEEYDFDVVCPYCDTEFSVDFSEGPKESIICPECDNIVELDWNEDTEECSHECHECGDECKHKNDDLDNEDDM